MSGLDALLAGHTLADRYRIGEVIGRGGFAVVYEAHDERLNRTVAVKVIMLSGPHGAAASETRARFEREARASAGLQHPNVAAIYDFGTDPTLGLDFLVMERLRGQDLRARLAAPEPVPLDEGLRILAGAAAGVAAGHRAGIIHRDVKPANIFLAEQPGAARTRICVLDFGIALLAQGDETRLTQHGIPLSVAYAAPEQLAGEQELTPAADVFALGVVAYELLGGKRPYSADPLRAAEERKEPPADLRALNPAVPPHVAAAVERALAYDPAERFPDAGGFAAALGTPAVPAPVQSAAVAAGDSAGPETPSQRAPVRRRGLPLALGAVLVLAVLAAALLIPRGRHRERVAVAPPSSAASPAAGDRRAAPAPAVPPPARTATDNVTRSDRPAAPQLTRPAPVAAPSPATAAAPPSPPPAAIQPAPPPSVPPAPPPSPVPAANPPAQAPVRSAHAEASPSLPSGGAEFRENLSHPCQSNADAGAALACLNRDLNAADQELNAAYHDAMARLDGPQRQALLDSERAWLARYDQVITSYYSRPWAGHSRIRVLPSQIQALRDRTAYLRRVGSG